MSFQEVDFNHAGALSLCRKLWDLAETLESAKTSRETEAGLAHKEWQGPDGDEFRRKSGLEPDEFDDAVQALKDAATSWAQAWASATNENNKRRYEAEVEAERASRGAGERFFDNFLGDDSAEVVGPAPNSVLIPSPPEFTAT